MSSPREIAITNMFNVCYSQRNNFPEPASCTDEQLHEFLHTMNYKWSVNDGIISKGVDDSEDDSGKTMKTLIEQCCYYEDMIDAIEFEIHRRKWLSTKSTPKYSGTGQYYR